MTKSGLTFWAYRTTATISPVTAVDADKGNASAQYNLGLMYAKGEGVPQNDADSLKWFRLAALQGQADALKWYQRAADKGNASARPVLVKACASLRGG